MSELGSGTTGTRAHRILSGALPVACPVGTIEALIIADAGIGSGGKKSQCKEDGAGKLWAGRAKHMSR